MVYYPFDKTLEALEYVSHNAELVFNQGLKMVQMLVEQGLWESIDEKYVPMDELTSETLYAITRKMMMCDEAICELSEKRLSELPYKEYKRLFKKAAACLVPVIAIFRAAEHKLKAGCHGYADLAMEVLYHELVIPAKLARLIEFSDREIADIDERGLW